MTSLDDERTLLAGDPSGMLRAVASLPRQCAEGYRLAISAPDLPTAEGVQNVAVCGMGGSAVAGDVLRALAATRIGVPVQVVRSPELPEWCQPHARRRLQLLGGHGRDARVPRGGGPARVQGRGRDVGERVRRLAEELGLGRVVVPGGLQPRAAVGLLTLGTIGAVEAAGLLPAMRGDVDECVRELEVLVDRLAPGVPATIDLEAGRRGGRRVRACDVGRRGSGRGGRRALEDADEREREGARVRLVAPELDHNEVVGWSQDRGHGYLVVALRHDGEHPDVAARFELSTRIADDAGARTIEVWAHGRSALARLFSLVVVGDFTSTYLGISRGVDPTPVDAISRLKAALAEP